MPAQDRRAIIQKIEEERGSKVITYVTGDRAPIPAQVGDDAVRPIYTLVREIGRAAKLDLFLYTRGGAIDVPWRIVTQLRRSSDEWDILIPFRANSAGTLIALGADKIVLGSQGELGPIDPTMSIRRMVPGTGGQGTFVQDSISVEDVMAYVRFINERAGLTDQASRAGVLEKLVERVDPVAIGNVYRTHSHIRDVARRILLSRRTPATGEVLDRIVETLAERVYAHGHAVGYEAAQEIGLPVSIAEGELDAHMWQLLESYETDMRLLEPLDPAAVVQTQDTYSEDAVIAVVESSETSYEFSGRIDVRAKRQMPQQLNVSVNMNLQLPPGTDVQQLPANTPQLLQQLLQQVQQSAVQNAQQAVQQALAAQAPLLAAEAAFRNGRWNRVG